MQVIITITIKFLYIDYKLHSITRKHVKFDCNKLELH